LFFFGLFWFGLFCFVLRHQQVTGHYLKIIILLCGHMRAAVIADLRNVRLEQVARISRAFAQDRHDANEPIKKQWDQQECQVQAGWDWHEVRGLV
jgi:hypothetical protein